MGSGIFLVAATSPSRRGQEDAATVGAGHTIAVLAIVDRPFPFALPTQFIDLLLGWHAPILAPRRPGRIVVGVARDVSGQLVVCLAVARPKFRFLIHFTPGKIIAVLRRLVGPYIGGRPFHA